MYGAIIGDYIGSTREHEKIKGYCLDLFPPRSQFTDETILIAATCQAVIKKQNPDSFDFAKEYRRFAKQYPNCGFGELFEEWVNNNSQTPTQSSGNGCASRVIPLSYLPISEGALLELTKMSCISTHDNSDAIEHASAVSLTLFLARKGVPIPTIKARLKREYFIQVEFDLSDLHKSYEFSANCADSVPQAIFCGLSANNYIDAIRRGLYIGGDTDSILTISGAIAEARFPKDKDFLGLKAQIQKELEREYPGIKGVYDRFDQYLNGDH